MESSGARVLRWAPRALAFLVAAFLSLFAMDVFGEGLGPWQAAAALLVHLLPTWLILLAVFASWRRPWVGAVSFMTLAAAYVAWNSISGRAFGVWPVVWGPLALIGLLYLFEWRSEARSPDARPLAPLPPAG